MTAEGSVYQRKSDGRWVAQYMDFKGKTRYLYRKTKREARKALRLALKDRDDGYVPADKLTVGMYLDEWMGERKNSVSARTWRVQESILRCHVKQTHVGSQRLSKLSGRDMTGLYRKMLSNGLAASTISQIHVLTKQALSTISAYAVKLSLCVGVVSAAPHNGDGQVCFCLESR